MNIVINQDYELIISTGTEGSHIRNAQQFNITMAKLIDKIKDTWSLGGIYRHCDYSDLEYIMKQDNIPKEKHSSLVNTAYFYFDKSNKNNH